MKPDIPLKAIACFDAVMRTGSALLAAEQMCVTPGAVGQQVRKLEAWLGVALFTRSVRKLHPTQAALSYWDQVQPALIQLENASLALRNRQDQGVRLSLPPAFANSWFARRMPTLIDQDTQLKLHLSASTELVDVTHDGFDLAVRHCDGLVQGLVAELLRHDEVRVYCSPSYRERLRLRTLADLKRMTLLYTTSHAHWPNWLTQVGLGNTEVGTGIRFDQPELAIDAARRGQGLVLTSPWLVEDALEQGQLVQVFEAALTVGKGYYLVHSDQSPLRAPVERLRQWLLASALECSPLVQP
ncbi:LysR substrate-binding domain-containing protein [Pseudomonas sp. P7759]|uniref:LysR substrate-binding domain-containing protein n=1 Tax=Pseudomonas sp. P7759 TaxID=2738831 RepID=UPI00210E7B6D|nr:LysR substrate-binding domain-containing protein [Pseudomonas sp. P7759]